MSLIRTILLAASISVSLGSCNNSRDADMLPSKVFFVDSTKQQEIGTREVVGKFARGNGFTLSKAHYPAEFGCSNIFRLTNTDGEILIINPFDYKYRVIVYPTKGVLSAPRLYGPARDLSVEMGKAPTATTAAPCS